jgi:uncharacterized protein (TIGR02996 family)
MSDEAFLRAIRGNRDDISNRLVYADWLDEQGDPRGEYLRLTCKLSELGKRIDAEWIESVKKGRFASWSIRLSSKRFISLRELRQSLVYEGLIEGIPTTSMNQRIIERMVAEERARHPNGGEPYLIQPVERPTEYPRGVPKLYLDSNDKPAELPAVACIGRFHSRYGTAEADPDCSSELTVIWFQDDFALPIAVEVWPRLVAIDWDQHAIDYGL